MRYNNKFFATKDEAKAFQKEHGGAIYSNIPRSRTKSNYLVETWVAQDARGETVDPVVTPWVVAWNEHD